MTKDYREGVVSEDDQQVTFEFQSPYIIGATPAGSGRWGIFEPGCRNGLVLKGKASCAVSVSTDRGATWVDCGQFLDGLDLTDRVKGRRDYLLRFHAGAQELAKSNLLMVTVCQANSSVLPRLKDGGSKIRFQASGHAVVSAGPDLPSARPFVTAGKFGTPKVTMSLATPRQETVTAVHAAAHVLSGSPPRPELKYQMDVSTDAGQTWQPIVKDWTVLRQGEEPKDFWSQSMCWGTRALPQTTPGPVMVRFANNGGKPYARCEVHLEYKTSKTDDTRVTFAWVDDQGPHQASQRVASAEAGGMEWTVPTGKSVRTRWVEFAVVLR